METIKKHRKSLKITQETMAKQMNISRRQYIQIEKGRCSVARLLEACSILGLELSFNPGKPSAQPTTPNKPVENPVGWRQRLQNKA